MKQRERKYLAEKKKNGMFDEIVRANIYKVSIEKTDDKTATAYHYDGNQYKIGCNVRFENGKTIFGFDKSDLRKLRKLPVPEITLAPPSVITAEPYFKPQ